MLTIEQREQKRLELSTKYGCEVKDWTIENPKHGQVLCFAKEPTIHILYAAFDKMLISPSSAGELIMEGVIIKEESDPRIFDTAKSSNFDIILSMNLKCQGLVQFAIDDVKKK